MLFGGRGASSGGGISKTLKKVKRSMEYNKAMGQSSIKDIYEETLYNYITKNESTGMGIKETLKFVKRSIDLNKKNNSFSEKDNRLKIMYNYIKNKK